MTKRKTDRKVTLTADVVAWAAEKYGKGYTSADIAQFLGVTQNTLGTAFGRYGITKEYHCSLLEPLRREELDKFIEAARIKDSLEDTRRKCIKGQRTRRKAEARISEKEYSEARAIALEDLKDSFEETHFTGEAGRFDKHYRELLASGADPIHGYAEAQKADTLKAQKARLEELRRSLSADSN